MAHPGAEGEMLAGAAAVGIPFCLSTSSSMSLEDVAAAAPGPWWPGAPDLVAEVVSPGDTDKEVATKVGEWLAAGARVVLVIDPAPRTVTIHRPSAVEVVVREGDALELPDLFPGWSLHVATLFAQRPR